MSKVQAFPLDSSYTIKIIAPPEFQDDLKQEIEIIWGNELIKRGHSLTNGIVYSLAKHDNNLLEIQEIDYKTVVSHRIRPDLFHNITIHPLAVTGILICPTGIVLGRRSDLVSTHAGFWELAPAGGLSLPEPTAQILEELHEELGLDSSALISIEVCGLIEDIETGVFDIILTLKLSLSENQIRFTHEKFGSNEYSEITIIPVEKFPQFMNENQHNILSILPEALILAKII